MQTLVRFNLTDETTEEIIQEGSVKDTLGLLLEIIREDDFIPLSFNGDVMENGCLLLNKAQVVSIQVKPYEEPKERDSRVILQTDKPTRGWR